MELLSLESWDWAEATEDVARQMAKDMAEEAERIVRGAEAFVAALRKQVAFSDALRADAEDLAAATRRMQEKSLRRLAAAEVERIVEPGVPGFLRAASEKTDSSLERGHVPTPDELAKAAAAEDAAAMLARMSDRLTRRAAAARDGEEAFVGGLRRQAANADAARATVEDFAASVRRFRAAAGSGTSLPDHDGAGAGHMTNIALKYLILTGYLWAVGSENPNVTD
ncbi:hypothetical protein EJB05_52339, partial [Eragrostis curvula]